MKPHSEREHQADLAAGAGRRIARNPCSCGTGSPRIPKETRRVLDPGAVGAGIGVDLAAGGLVEHRLDEPGSARAGVIERTTLGIEPVARLVELGIGLVQHDMRVARGMADLARKVGVGLGQAGMQCGGEVGGDVAGQGRGIDGLDMHAGQKRPLHGGRAGRELADAGREPRERETLAGAGGTEQADTQGRGRAFVRREFGEMVERAIDAERVDARGMVRPPKMIFVLVGAGRRRDQDIGGGHGGTLDRGGSGLVGPASGHEGSQITQYVRHGNTPRVVKSGAGGSIGLGSPSAAARTHPIVTMRRPERCVRAKLREGPSKAGVDLPYVPGDRPAKRAD